MAQIFHPFPRLPSELKDEIWNFALPGPRMITLSISHTTTPPTPLTPATYQRGVYYVTTKTNVNAIPTGLLHACQHSREVAMASYTPALGRTLGSPIFLDSERDTVFFAQPPARGPPNTGPYCYVLALKQDLEVIRHVAFPPIAQDSLGISLVDEFPGLRSVVLPSEKNTKLVLRMGVDDYMFYPRSLPTEQEAFEAEFEMLWLKGRRKLGLDESNMPKIIWMSKAELYSKVENEKVILKT
jgi:hypothetical protein